MATPSLASVVQGSVADCFTYDSEHNRIQMDARASSCSGTLSTSTIYLNDPISGSLEEKLVSGGVVSYRDYITADGAIVAMRTSSPSTVPPVWNDPSTQWGSFTWTASAPPIPVYTYIVSDHLGSTSVLTDGSGMVSERDSYDAWGRRRNPDGSDAASCTAITSATTRGFTAQEHMDPVCAINFNARLYDPTVGRFLSADSIVPNPMDGQSFNRYSYVENGPLSATDPTGHDCPSHNGNDCNKLQGGYGPPCYDCYGPGEDIDKNGNLVPVSQLAFYSGTATDPATGSISHVSFRLDQLASTLGNIFSDNPNASVWTNVPGLNGASIGYSDGNLTFAGLGGQSVTGIPYDMEGNPVGQAQISVTIADTNGGFNNGVYYGGVAPIYVSGANMYVGPRPSRAQMASDFQTFRSNATRAALAPLKLGGDDLYSASDAINSFNSSSTARFFNQTPAMADHRQDLQMYIAAVAYNPVSGFTGEADFYQDQLYLDAGYESDYNLKH